ncbi:MAG: tyrosine-type recombinase/integrase [Pseudonocardiaceae bacterium]
MTGAMTGAVAWAASAAWAACEFPLVLDGTSLEGPAARLAGLLDPAFLAEAGWDPVTRVLSLPAQHRLLGRTLCRVEVCTATAHGTKIGGLCWRCFTRLCRAGMTAEEIGSSAELPALAARPAGCSVPGCQRLSPGGGSRQRTGWCQAHSRRFRRTPGMPIEQFLADPKVRPLPALGPCDVAACARRAESEHGYCPTHYVRWRNTVAADPGRDQRHWQLTQPAVSEGGQVSLRGVSPLVVVEVLFGIQQRTRGGAKLTEVNLRAIGDALRREQVASIQACEANRVSAGKPARSLLRALVREVGRALADPSCEQVKDTWDLGVFGHPGRLTFTGIAQPWLRQAAKRWAAQELPRHRGAGAANVQQKINALARLSESLRARPDGGLIPAALGRADIENFLNRLAYLESAGKISRYHRNVLCRGVRAALAGIRALGLTRTGQTAAGLPGDVSVGLGDIPAEPVRGEPGRDLPPEIMAMLCANLDTLEPAEVKVATQIAIDTGRRPEDILGLPLDCLARDKDGAAVLVYDNAKADRLGRRLPISDATAAVITGQQSRVRARFPHAPSGELKLLPSPRRNPDGRKPITISMLEDRHRSWATGLGILRTRDGTEVDPARVIPYAYRHTYAQRHADAGVPIDVLAELLDHRNLNVTRRYYRIEEHRRRDAVDKVTALSFDRHGNRIWRDAHALLESEHARYAVGEVAVPYGTCTEPSNVRAGGGACPVRFRCAGCDHFRTDVSHLPELTGYLDDLLRTRERLAAAIDGVDEWARADATPTGEEITRIRRLINRVRGDIAGLTEPERTQIDDAVTVVRRHRAAHAVSLGMPGLRAAEAPLTTAVSKSTA